MLNEKDNEIKSSKIEDRLRPMYDALMLLPCLNDYNDENIKTLSDIFLALGNNEAFINFIILFSGKTIKIPKIEELELCVKILNAYNYYIRNYKSAFIDNNTIRIIFKRFKIEITRENLNFFKKIDSFLTK